MRLINVCTLELKEFVATPPPYAILSHTWGDDELSLQKWQSQTPTQLRDNQSAGCKKILDACEKAKEYALNYLWVDTVCIDKTSSAELSEAINSMFAWYGGSVICFAYLADVAAGSDPDSPDSGFRTSRWFTRGWTLQELLAPKRVGFYAADWSKLGRRGDHAATMSEITGIGIDYLTGYTSTALARASVAEKLSWAADRVTTRAEDIAYCLLGLFGVNMPLLYGEGKKAFVRLQEEIIKTSNDQSIFTWSWLPTQPKWPNAWWKPPPDVTEREVRLPERRLQHIGDRGLSPDNDYGMLAWDPVAFYACGRFRPREANFLPFAMTNVALSIRLRILEGTPGSKFVLAVLGCHSQRDLDATVCIMLRHEARGIYTRPKYYPRGPILLSRQPQTDGSLEMEEEISILRNSDHSLRSMPPQLWDHWISGSCYLQMVYPSGLNGYDAKPWLPMTHEFDDGATVMMGQMGIIFSMGWRVQPYMYHILMRFSASKSSLGSSSRLPTIVVFIGAVRYEDGALSWYVEPVADLNGRVYGRWLESVDAGQRGTRRGLRPLALADTTPHEAELLESIKTSPRKLVRGEGVTAAVGKTSVFAEGSPGAVLEVFFHPGKKMRPNTWESGLGPVSITGGGSVFERVFGPRYWGAEHQHPAGGTAPSIPELPSSLSHS